MHVIYVGIYVGISRVPTPISMTKCDGSRKLVPFVQFKNVKTHGGVLLLVRLQASASNFTKSITALWVFSLVLDCTNGTKSRNASQIDIKLFHNSSWLSGSLDKKIRLITRSKSSMLELFLDILQKHQTQMWSFTVPTCSLK